MSEKLLKAVLIMCILFYDYSNCQCASSSNQATAYTKEFTLDNISGSSRRVAGIRAGSITGDYFIVWADENQYQANLRYNVTSSSYFYNINIDTPKTANQLMVTSDESFLHTINANGAWGSLDFNADTGKIVSNLFSKNFFSQGEDLAKISLSPDDNTLWMTAQDNRGIFISIIKKEISSNSIQVVPLTDSNSVRDPHSFVALSDYTWFISYRSFDSEKKILSKVLNFDSSMTTWSRMMICPSLNCTIYSSEAIMSGDFIYNAVGVETEVILTIHSSLDGAVSGSRRSFTTTSPSTSIDVLSIEKVSNYLYMLLNSAGGSYDGYYLLKYHLVDDTLLTYLYNPLNSWIPHQIAYNSVRDELAFATKGCAVHQFNVVSAKYIDLSPIFSSLDTPFVVEDIPDGEFNLVDTGSASISIATRTLAANSFGDIQNIMTNTSSQYVYNMNVHNSEVAQSYNGLLTRQTFSPSLTCSPDFTISITYSLQSHNSESVPTWATIDTYSGVITLDTPDVQTKTDYHFIVKSVFSMSDFGYVNTLITLTVCPTSGWSESNSEEEKDEEWKWGAVSNSETSWGVFWAGVSAAVVITSSVSIIAAVKVVKMVRFKRMPQNRINSQHPTDQNKR